MKVSVLRRLKGKTGGSKNLSHTGWNGERGYLRRGTRRKGERFESVRGECSMLKHYRKSYDFWCVEMNNSGLHCHSK